jgi:LacI family transcriptional regulator
MAARITMERLAQELGVSVSTVSRVFTRPDLVNARTARRVRDEAVRQGFHPNLTARSLVHGRTRLVGLLVPELTYLMGDYYSKFRFGVERALAARGYSLVLSAYVEGRGDVLVDLQSRVNVDGAIIVPRRLAGIERRELAKAQMPYVIADLEVDGLVCVHVSNVRLGYVMARHLVELGHRRIACLASTDAWENSVERLRGARACLDEFGIPVPEHYVQVCRFHAGYDDALERIPLFYAAPRDAGPTAILAANDDMAAAVYRFAEQTGRRIPSDLSVIGCDNTFYSRFLTPALTTIDQDAEALGDRAVRALLDGDDEARGPLPFRVIVRGSTAATRIEPRRNPT